MQDNAMQDKEWRSALIGALSVLYSRGGDAPAKARAGRASALQLIAEKVVALGGDMRAIGEIGDRLDGQPHASIALGPPRAAVELSGAELLAIANAMPMAQTHSAPRKPDATRDDGP